MVGYAVAQDEPLIQFDKSSVNDARTDGQQGSMAKAKRVCRHVTEPAQEQDHQYRIKAKVSDLIRRKQIEQIGDFEGGRRDGTQDQNQQGPANAGPVVFQKYSLSGIRHR